jgi:hypothetical protein
MAQKHPFLAELDRWFAITARADKEVNRLRERVVHQRIGNRRKGDAEPLKIPFLKRRIVIEEFGEDG